MLLSPLPSPLLSDASMWLGEGKLCKFPSKGRKDGRKAREEREAKAEYSNPSCNVALTGPYLNKQFSALIMVAPWHALSHCGNFHRAIMH